MIARARATGEIPATVPLPPSTVYRMLQREGLTAPIEAHTGSELRRFAYTYAGELWQADALHGPRVGDGKGRKTYLIAILDDATRVLPYSIFTFADTAAQFLRVLREGILRGGVFRSVFMSTTAGAFRTHSSVWCAHA